MRKDVKVAIFWPVGFQTLMEALKSWEQLPAFSFSDLAF